MRQLTQLQVWGCVVTGGLLFFLPAGQPDHGTAAAGRAGALPLN
jgi:hypothetical protein